MVEQTPAASKQASASPTCEQPVTCQSSSLPLTTTNHGIGPNPDRNKCFLPCTKRELGLQVTGEKSNLTQHE
ncbi:hypothetical protein DSO57_1012263 [Entomophthora muscae]|uniref:Uncharacterized protein n=1 Tax=Entomophthora muscae TaxID=34485 RepID=A0ACC2RX51_9FUNG|nr:hypothetical protein DSO57_1012263 [Entomophthora muscae]